MSHIWFLVKKLWWLQGLLGICYFWGQFPNLRFGRGLALWCCAFRGTFTRLWSMLKLGELGALQPDFLIWMVICLSWKVLQVISVHQHVIQFILWMLSYTYIWFIFFFALVHFFDILHQYLQFMNIQLDIPHSYIFRRARVSGSSCRADRSARQQVQYQARCTNPPRGPGMQPSQMKVWKVGIPEPKHGSVFLVVTGILGEIS